MKITKEVIMREVIVDAISLLAIVAVVTIF